MGVDGWMGGWVDVVGRIRPFVGSMASRLTSFEGKTFCWGWMSWLERRKVEEKWIFNVKSVVKCCNITKNKVTSQQHI